MTIFRRTLKRLGLYEFAKVVSRPVSTPIRKSLYDQRVVRAYRTAHPVNKLQVGSGTNLLPGWLNTHYYPGLRRLAEARREGNFLVHLDCDKPFPFEDGSFAYVFSEHMIEHIPYTTACRMLSECHRVLKPGGKIRISTPDLDVFLRLYRPDLTEDEIAYIASRSQMYFPNNSFPHPTFVLNNIVRNWEHTFIYDEDVLRHVLETAGFVDVKRCEFRVSDEEALSGLENLERQNNRFESLIMEGVRRPES
jgi:predicted SAM-dependent methyltransferase